MASKEEFSQLKKTVQEMRKAQLDILIRLEDLEDRLASLSGGEGGERKPKEPEAILTCTQCQAEYMESRNAEGSCKYHAGQLKGVGWDFKYTCCNKSDRDYDAAKTIVGCTKGKHHSKHHMEYPYAAYYFFMQDLSRKAKEVWMTLDVEDFVAERTEWAEIGLSDEGKVFVLLGASRIESTVYAEFTAEELKHCEATTFTILEKTDSVGWEMKAEMQSSNSIANAITVTIKPASSSVPLVKRVQLVFEGDTPRPGKVECLSNPIPDQPTVAYSVPEDSREGPVLDAGLDHSKDRKNDYETETTDDCPLNVQQHGHTEVVSSNKMANGKWNNLFTATVKVTNTAQENLAITNVFGEYMNKDGEWVKCGDQWIGKEFIRGRCEWFDSTNFYLEAASTGTLIARVAIQFSDEAPDISYGSRHAHPSLPQPLHLRFTFVDQQKRTASLRFEQGNSPLPLATRESREKSWSRNRPLEFHLFADDVTRRKRSDVALYYDDNGVLCYRPALNDVGGQCFFIGSSVARDAYKAKKAGEKEYELTKYTKENHGSTAKIFLLVDLDTGVAYALKMVITTATSSATGYYLLPCDDPSPASISAEPQEVPVKGVVTVNWKVPRASKNDRIEIYPRFGKSYVGKAVTNKEAATSGSVKLQLGNAVPGLHEIRYLPAWLKSNYTGARHHVYWGATVITVGKGN